MSAQKQCATERSDAMIRCSICGREIKVGEKFTAITLKRFEVVETNMAEEEERIIDCDMCSSCEQKHKAPDTDPEMREYEYYVEP